jgi:uncharacterized membrane protein
MAEASDRSSQTWLGSLLVAASATAYSTAGLFTRLIDLDIWTVLFWRGLFIAAYVIWENGRETGTAVRAIGTRGLWIAFFSTFATICFLNALRLTSVAEVTIINATSPFITGVLAWLFIGERERWTTVVASLFAFLGVIIMFDPASSAGHLAGNLLAFAMTISLAAMVVILRHSRAHLNAASDVSFRLPVFDRRVANRQSRGGERDEFHLSRSVRDDPGRARPASPHQWHAPCYSRPFFADRQIADPAGTRLGLARLRRGAEIRHLGRRSCRGGSHRE